MIDTGVMVTQMSELSMSTWQLAAAAGIPQPTVESILKGRTRPSPHILDRLCTVLDIDSQQVLKNDAEAKA